MQDTTLITSEFFIEGLDCPDESKIIEKRLKGLRGINSITPNFVQGKIRISHSVDIDPIFIAAEIEAAGLRVLSNNPKYKSRDEKPGFDRTIILVVFSGLFLIFGLVMRKLNASTEIQIGSFILSILTGGSLIAPKSFRAIKSKTLDMSVLMTVAVLGAGAIGEWAEGAAVAFLFSLSEYLERYSVSRARRAVNSLLNLTPATAFVKTSTGFEERSLVEVKSGDIVQVRAGARIPVDGVITTGSGSVNQAPITGESVPVEKNPGDIVYAGTINGEATLEIETKKEASESVLAGIVRLVEDAQGQRAPTQRFVDQFARIYTPAVFILAVLTLLVMPLFFGGDWNAWLYRSLVLIVIACPCALVISTPVSIVSGLTALAKRGVLVKGGTYLEALGKIRALAVDKTGTITVGKPRVTGVYPLNGESKNRILEIAAALDSTSDHPLAQAIILHAKSQNIVFPTAKDLTAVTGMGVRGSIKDHDYFLGNHHFVEKLGICTPELEKILNDLECAAQSVIVVGHAPHGAGDEEVLGVISVSDVIRPEAKAALAEIHRSGVKKIVMLSGDNTRTAQTIASQVGIDDAKGDLLPEGKVAAINELIKEFRVVAMIGDGINDAPAMAASTLGIAMGSVGTDTAIETADVTLMNDDLSKVAEAILMGRRTLQIIKFNIGLSIVVKFVFLGLAIFGVSSLWLAILADTGTTLIVIVNSLRLLIVREQT